jgi:hypothetical protein
MVKELYRLQNDNKEIIGKNMFQYVIMKDELLFLLKV